MAYVQPSYPGGKSAGIYDPAVAPYSVTTPLGGNTLGGGKDVAGFSTSQRGNDATTTTFRPGVLSWDSSKYVTNPDEYKSLLSQYQAGQYKAIPDAGKTTPPVETPLPSSTGQITLPPTTPSQINQTNNQPSVTPGAPTTTPPSMTPGSTPSPSTTAAKYQAIYNNPPSVVPATKGAAMTEIQKATPPQATPEQPYQPSPTFMAVGDPIMSQYIEKAISGLDEINNAGYVVNSLKAAQASKEATFDREAMNLQNIMDGTEQDIRNEITKAGGFATESQVQGLTVARNRDLIKQYNSLSLQRSAMENRMNAQIGLASTDLQYAQGKYDSATQAATLYQNLDKNGTDMLQKQVAQFGYSGLVSAYKDNPQMLAYAGQKLFGDPWILFKPDAVKSMETYRQQSLNQGAQRLQVQVQNTGSLMDYRTAMEAQRYTSSTNNIVNKFLNLPTYKLYANSLPYFAQIQAAQTVPGSVSDRDLLDAVTKINTGGNQVTEAQVGLITGGRSYSDSVDVWSKKLQSGGILSDDQRQQLTTLAGKIYENYDRGYQALKPQIQKALDKSGIPAQYQSIPDLSELAGGYGLNDSQNIAAETATVDGQTYTIGSDGNYHLQQ